MKIVYLGFNSFLTHKRGVENVIEFQSKSYEFDYRYYVHLGDATKCYKYEKFICFSLKKNLFWPVMLNLLLWKLKIQKKVTIHSHNPLLTFFFIGKTNILTVHDGLYYQSKMLNKGKSVLFYLIEISSYYKTSLVHFISSFTKYRSLFPRDKASIVIYNTSHLEYKLVKQGLSKKYLDVQNILCVRSIEERSRFDLIMDLALYSKESNIHINVAGKGPLLDYYRSQCTVNQIKNVSFLGYVDDNQLLELYANCDIVLVIAEYGEGFGLPIIEGYLHNKPVLASNRCAIPEVIISKDYLFENNIGSIIKAIEGINKGMKPLDYRKHYDANFSVKIISKQFADLYKTFDQ